jgi:hypothetical protein
MAVFSGQLSAKELRLCQISAFLSNNLDLTSIKIWTAYPNSRLLSLDLACNGASTRGGISGSAAYQPFRVALY